MKISYSSHAVEKMNMYGLEKEEVDSIVRKGMRWKVEGKVHASMSGFEVVFIKEADSIFVITAYPVGD